MKQVQFGIFRIFHRTLGRNGMKFVILMYPDNLRNSFDHSLWIFKKNFVCSVVLCQSDWPLMANGCHSCSIPRSSCSSCDIRRNRQNEMLNFSIWKLSSNQAGGIPEYCIVRHFSSLFRSMSTPKLLLFVVYFTATATISNTEPAVACNDRYIRTPLQDIACHLNIYSDYMPDTLKRIVQQGSV